MGKPASMISTPNFSTSSFYVNKPWAGFKCSSATTTYTSSFNQTGVSVANSTLGSYVFTMPNHPQGINYMVYVQQMTAAASTTIALYGINIISSTSFSVFSKTTANAVVASSFYVHTVP